MRSAWRSSRRPRPSCQLTKSAVLATALSGRHHAALSRRPSAVDVRDMLPWNRGNIWASASVYCLLACGPRHRAQLDTPTPQLGQRPGAVMRIRLVCSKDSRASLGHVSTFTLLRGRGICRSHGQAESGGQKLSRRWVIPDGPSPTSFVFGGTVA